MLAALVDAKSNISNIAGLRRGRALLGENPSHRRRVLDELETDVIEPSDGDKYILELTDVKRFLAVLLDGHVRYDYEASDLIVVRTAPPHGRQNRPRGEPVE